MSDIRIKSVHSTTTNFSIKHFCPPTLKAQSSHLIGTCWLFVVCPSVCIFFSSWPVHRRQSHHQFTSIRVNLDFFTREPLRQFQPDMAQNFSSTQLKTQLRFFSGPVGYCKSVCPMSVCKPFFFLLLWRTTAPISARLGTTYWLVKVTQICINKGPVPHPIGD